MLLHRVGDVGEATDEHHCVVAGLKADGRLTDVWSEMQAHLDSRFVAYVPRCVCGWTGPPFSNTSGGYAACEQLWRNKHLQPFLSARQPRCGRPLSNWAPRVIHGGLAPELG